MKPLTSMIAHRLLQAPLVLMAVYTVTLALAWGAPGSPLDDPEGRRPPAEVERAMKEKYNLDSFWSFYWSYLDCASGVRYARDRLAGRARPDQDVFDLGPSLRDEDWRVNEIIGASLPVSAALGLAAVALAVAIGVTAGVVGAARPNSALDAATLTLALVGISIPSFVVGTVLILIFPVALGWGRIGVWGGGGAGGLGSLASDWFLPALTLSLPYAAYIARLTRMGMIDAMRSDYVRTARAKGLSESRVLLVHALRNAILPVVAYLGPATALAMTGSFVVERVFNVPGLGQHFVNAVLSKDVFLLMGVVLVFSTMLILMNLAADVASRIIDPRLAASA